MIPSFRHASTTASPFPILISSVNRCPIISSTLYRFRATGPPFDWASQPNSISGLVERGKVTSEPEIDEGERLSTRIRPGESSAVCQGAVGADQELPPQHRVDAANPSVNQIDRGLRRRVHDHGSLARYGFNRDW